MLNLHHELQFGLKNLQQWRNRYDYKSYDSVYPLKIVTNIFYRRYTTNLIWSEIMKFADQDIQMSVNEAQIFLINLYQKTAVHQVSPVIEKWLEDNPNEYVGGIHFNGFKKLIYDASHGDKKALEELEFDYLFYLLSDMSCIYWASLCSSGVSKIDAIAQLSGFLINPMPLDDYAVISNGLGQLLVGKFLEENYIPLP